MSARRATALAVALLAAFAAFAVGAPPAAAEPRATTIPDQPARIVLDDGWTATTAGAEALAADPDAPRVTATHADGGTLAITVAPAPNIDAWRTKKRRAYLAEIVAGFRAEPGVTVDKHRDTRVKGVPTLELWLTRQVDGAREHVVVRLLLFRTRTVAAAAAGPRAARKRLEAAARGLEPLHEADPDR